MPVCDASVVTDWVAPDVGPATPAVALAAALATAGDPVVGPRLLAEEVPNALLRGVRRHRFSGVAADEAVRLFRRLPIDYVDELTDRERAWELSRRFDNHPLYDMLYVALAERLGQRLYTADEVLSRRLRQLTWVVPVRTS
jgi:predicted nucleic acid-binding protein